MQGARQGRRGRSGYPDLRGLSVICPVMVPSTSRAAVRVAHLTVLPFSLGLSVFVISIFLVSLTGPVTDGTDAQPETQS